MGVTVGVPVGAGVTISVGVGVGVGVGVALGDGVGVVTGGVVGEEGRQDDCDLSVLAPLHPPVLEVDNLRSGGNGLDVRGRESQGLLVRGGGCAGPGVGEVVGSCAVLKRMPPFWNHWRAATVVGPLRRADR